VSAQTFGHCRDCSWWSTGDYDEIENPPGYGACDFVSNAWWIPGETVAAVRPNEYGNLLTTHADFGCNQFDARD
jgi:hypothetical protein